MVEGIFSMGSRLPLVLHISKQEEWFMQIRGVYQTYTGARPSPQEREEHKLYPGTKTEEELGEGRKQDSLCPPYREK